MKNLSRDGAKAQITLGDTALGVKASTPQASCWEKLRAAYSVACATCQKGIAPGGNTVDVS